jgi:hypothetical protein
VEIRKLLREVSRVEERALGNARRVRNEGASAVEAAKGRLGRLENEVVKFGVASLSLVYVIAAGGGPGAQFSGECHCRRRDSS